MGACVLFCAVCVTSPDYMSDQGTDPRVSVPRTLASPLRTAGAIEADLNRDDAPNNLRNNAKRRKTLTLSSAVRTVLLFAAPGLGALSAPSRESGRAPRTSVVAVVDGEMLWRASSRFVVHELFLWELEPLARGEAFRACEW